MTVLKRFVFQLKNSAELRRKLEEQVHMLQKELELSIAAQSKLRIELNLERSDNAIYRSFTRSLLSKLSKGNVVHVTDGFNNYMVNLFLMSVNKFFQSGIDC